MKVENIALIGLVFVIVIALSTVILAQPNEDGTGTLFDDIYNNLFGVKVQVEIGDCVDLNFIGRKVSDNEAFASSYADIENKTDGIPVKLFISDNITNKPTDEEYSAYTVNIFEGFIDIQAFIDGIVGLHEGEEKTIGPIPPEKAYGIKPREGDIIDIPVDMETTQPYKIFDIQEDVPMPLELQNYFGTEPTTLAIFREDWHYIDEIIENADLSWDNSTIVTKINETVLWTYTTPSTSIGENFTCINTDTSTGLQIFFPENSSTITSMNDTHIVILHSPPINSTIIESNPFYGAFEYTVDSVTADKINVSITEGENTEYNQYDRTTTILRNRTQNVTLPPLPSIYFEQALFAQMRSETSDFIYSFHELAGEDLYFDVVIESVSKCSES